jgi:hypothetical protein
LRSNAKGGRGVVGTEGGELRRRSYVVVGVEVRAVAESPTWRAGSSVKEPVLRLEWNSVAVITQEVARDDACVGVS